MLSKILSKDECAACKFCCVFEREDAWEAPLFTPQQKDMLEKKYPDVKLKAYNGMYTVDIIGAMKNDTPGEEVACPFLSDNGCVLNDTEKSFDCKIWPFRIMKKGDSLVIAQTPTCRCVNKYSAEFLSEYIHNGLCTEIFEYAQKMPGIIKEYRDGFPVLSK